MIFETHLLGFVAASLIVLLIPGPGVLYVIARSLAQGRRAGLISALGLSIGALAHVAAAVIGLSSLLVASATAFGIVKLLGAGYLIYLGMRILFSGAGAGTSQIEKPDHAPLSRLFLDGVIVSVFNPKVAVFFLAFLPQFANPDAGSLPIQFLLLGLLYACLAFLTDGAYALLASSARELFTGAAARSPIPRFLNGGVFVALGIKAALTERPG